VSLLPRITRPLPKSTSETGSRRRIIERLEWEIGAEIGSLSLSGVTAQLAFRSALAATLSILIAVAIHLDAPFWAGITAFGMLQSDMAATLSRSLDRVLGTVTGAVLGYFGTASVGDHTVFFVLCTTVVSSALYTQARVQHSYAVLLMGVTFLLVMFGSLSMPESALNLAVYRGLEVTLGAVVASVVDILLAPDSGNGVPGKVLSKPGVFSLPIDVDQLTVALSGGLAIASVPIVWTSLRLPGLGQTPITAIVIFIAIQRDPQWTAIMRIVGCLIGGAYGLLSLAIVSDFFALWAGFLFLGLYIAGHVLQRRGEASYMGHQAGVSVILAMAVGLAPSTDILPAIDRLVGIFGGILWVTVFQMLFALMIRRCILAVMQPH
jgi:uncharacterized membrane protein YgaE (UPF0421/DUF939 family)